MSMEKSDDLDILLAKVCHEDVDRIDGLNSIEVPSMDWVLSEFRRRKHSTMYNKKVLTHSKKTKSVVLHKFINVAAATLLILFSSFILSIITKTPEVKAFKFNIIKTINQLKNDLTGITHRSDNLSPTQPSNSPLPGTHGDVQDVVVRKLPLNEIIEKVNIRIAIPGYVPKGYLLTSAELTEFQHNTRIIRQVYENKEFNSIIMLKQTSNQKNINVASVTPSHNVIRQYKVLGEDCTIISSTQGTYQVLWFKDENRYDIIFNNISEDEVIKILDGIKKSDK